MKEISLYIHIPFCKQKCLYCDFPSYGGKDEFISDYIDALNLQIEKEAKEYLINSIFIGGGTPSHLPPRELEKLLKKISELNFSDIIEYSVECNPGSLTEEKLIIMKKYGVNRISMGLQSTDDSLLKGIGRIHTYNVFKDNFNLARKVGFRNINVDLMFGLPNQTIEQWEKTLEDIILLGPEHISAYSLIIEEGTPFYKLWEKDLLKLPSEDDERVMYEITKNKLKEGGYHQYEISNYCKGNKECYHNKVYWKCKEYLGLGVSSSSYINGKRIKNIDSIEEYIEKVNNGQNVKDEILENTLNDNMEEFMFMGLRMVEGIKEEEFYLLFGKKIDDVYKSQIEKNINLNLLERSNGKIFLTEKGFELSNAVMSEFIL
ncbi:MAG: radical SAM family heme chaperone HemW [Clostridium sp.]